MGAPSLLRLPTAPLIEFLRRRLGEHPNLALVTDGKPTAAMMAVEAGVTLGQMQGVIQRSFMLHATADQYASQLGVHPTAIWGDAYYRLTEIDGHRYVDPDDLKGTPCLTK